MTLDTELEMKKLYSEESILNPNPEKIEHLIELASYLTEEMHVNGEIDYDNFIKFFEEGTIISNSARHFIDLNKAILESADTTNDYVLRDAMANACVSSMISALLEVIYLRKIARRAIEDKKKLKDLLDMVCKDQPIH